MKKNLIITATALYLATSLPPFGGKGGCQSLQWAKSMGGIGGNVGTSIATDASGNVYTTGRFYETADFDPGPGIFNLTPADFSDIFISKLDGTGNFLWAKSMGGPGTDNGSSIALDASGNVYTIGSFSGTADFDPGAGTFYLTSAGSIDIFISKLDSSGNLVWAKIIGGTSSDQGKYIALDASGNVNITGVFGGTADFDPGAGTFSLTSAGGDDIFVAKLDGSGNFVWAKAMGSTNVNGDYASSIALDASGNVYSTGYFFEGTADFDPGPGTFYLTSAGNVDIFISKLDGTGNFVWAKAMGGTSSDQGSSIDLDASGNVYTTGVFYGTADFDPGPGTFNLTSAGGNADIFISKLDGSGNFVWAKAMGGTDVDLASSIATDASGNVYSTGRFYGTSDFDPGAGTFNLTSLAGSADIFISKLDSSGNFVLAKAMGGPSIENGSSIALDASGNVYTTGYFYGTADFDPGVGIFNLTSAGGEDIFVAKYRDCGLQIPICLVTVDSTSTKNVIIWEKPITTNIDSFRIYREFGLNNYVYIGSVSYSALSEFIDTTGGVNPNIQSYRYKISVIDTCGNESALSNAHRTIHLSTPQYTPPSKFDLIWTNDYEGFTISGYNILRDGNNTGIWDSIGFVTFGNFSYTDINAPSDSAKYIIQAAHPTGCTAGKKGTDYNSSVSNSSSILSVPGSLTAIATSTNATQSNCDGSATVTAGGGTPPYTYAWSTTPVQTAATATGLCGNTTYTVLVTDSAGNTVSKSVLVGELTGIVEPGVQSSMLKIYPNPNRGVFTVEILNNEYRTTNVECRIYDVLGREILNSKFANRYFEVNLSAQPAGMYHLQVVSDSFAGNRRVVIE